MQGDVEGTHLGSQSWDVAEQKVGYLLGLLFPYREVPDKLSLSLNPCVPITGHGLKGATAHPYLVAYVDKLS